MAPLPARQEYPPRALGGPNVPLHPTSRSARPGSLWVPLLCVALKAQGGVGLRALPGPEGTG